MRKRAKGRREDECVAMFVDEGRMLVEEWGLFGLFLVESSDYILARSPITSSDSS